MDREGCWSLLGKDAVVLHLITLLFLVPAASACLYYIVLALIGVMSRARSAVRTDTAVHTFAIVIPAHNEEAALGSTLASCAGLDYPCERVQTFVIADNCTDDTAGVAARAGAIVLERHDSLLHGKGHALEWGLPQVLQQQPDAVLVLDADCRIDRDALRVFDHHLSSGESVLQAAVRSGGADTSAISYAVSVGSVLENDLFYRPKDRLGLAVFLRGTGMVLARSVLEEQPWRAHSVVEDVEYTLWLLRTGRTVRFVDGVSIHTDAPVDLGQLNAQRRRWTAGTFRFGKRRALKLMIEGILQRRWRLFDAGVTLLVQIKPLVLLHLFLGLCWAALAAWADPGLFSNGLLTLGGAIVLLYACWAGLGVYAVGITRQRLMLLCRLPLVIAGMVGIFIGGMLYRDSWMPARRPPRPVRC
jgi:cellulose synthase/poly-beta-1,6-N-acetylglucosamine synthase-like glycosyltransferase